MKKIISLFILINFFSCKNFSENANGNDFVDKNGKVYHNDKTDMIIRDYDETTPVIIEAIELKNNGKILEAINKFNVAEKKYGKRLSIYLNRGICYDRLDKKEDAIVEFTKCLHIKDDYYVALQNRGIVYMNIGEDFKALGDFNKAIQIDPSEPAGYLNRALLYKVMAKFDESCSDAKKSIELGFIEKYNNDLPQNIADEVCQ